MEKKLDILIPHYHETAEEIMPLLDSIALQQQVDLKNDVGVIICHDGKEPDINDSVNCGDFFPKEDESKSFDFYDDAGIGGNYSIFRDYPFEIKQIRQEHKGVSAARNACLDASTADYVMFCDADDLFFNMCGLYIVFREMKGDGFNALTSVFIEETKDQNGEKIYINREMDSTFVHGKIYRRSFLKNNNVRWNESLTIHEDSYFNCLAQKMTAEVKYCQQPFYLWKWRDASVCRHDPKYILKTYNNMLDSNTALVNELLKRNKKTEAAFYSCSMIYDAYYTMNKQEWLDQENQDYRLKTEKRFQTYYHEFKSLFESIQQQQRLQIVMGMRNRFFGEGLLLESITFDDWIKHIEEL